MVLHTFCSHRWPVPCCQPCYSKNTARVAAELRLAGKKGPVLPSDIHVLGGSLWRGFAGPGNACGAVIGQRALAGALAGLA